MEKVKGKRPRLLVRMGVLPTKVERDRTKYCRKEKHKTVFHAGRPESGHLPLGAEGRWAGSFLGEWR